MPYPSFSLHYPIITPFFTSSKALKMALSRTTFCFKRSYKEGLFFDQNSAFDLKLSKLCYIHRLRYRCNGLYTFKKKKRVTRSSSYFDEGIEEFKSYMANEHSLTTTTHNN
jgi:hypothetical protein